MRILWITNILFPEASTMLTGETELKASGGWLLGSAEILKNTDNIILSVATVSTLVDKLEVLQGDRIIYYVLPYGKGNQKC